MKIEDIKSHLNNNGWRVNPDKLFINLLKNMLENKEDIGKEYTVSEIVKKLDCINEENNIIDNPNSYNTAKKVMFSERNGRDYFNFKDKDIQNNLTDIVKKIRSGFDWYDYNNEKVSINPKYSMKIAAGNNEKKFIEMCKSYGIADLLKGKKVFDNRETDLNRKVSISVDNSIKSSDNKDILIEIDSGNMAKLIVGQYTLLNILCSENNKNIEDIIFIVIHYYKDYNTQRTIKNLELVSKIMPNKKAIKFKVYNLEEFKEICKNNKNKKDRFIKELLS